MSFCSPNCKTNLIEPFSFFSYNSLCLDCALFSGVGEGKKSSSNEPDRKGENLMNRRERILLTLQHKQPDRVPIDLGAMDSTGIAAIAYNRLKKYLKMEGGTIRIHDPYSQIAWVEDSILERVRADVKPVFIGPRQWKPSQLPDGSPSQIPKNWNPETLPDGSQVVRDPNGLVVAQMPANGFYFEPVAYPLRDVQTVSEVEKRRSLFESADWPDFADEDYSDLARKARELYEKTDYALMGNFCAHIFAGAQLLRGYDTFLMDLLTNPALAECIMNELAEAYIRRFDHYVKAIGPYVQIINVNDDLGTQNAPMVSPALFRKMVKPYQGKLYRYIKSHFSGYLFLHSDGSIYPLIPDLIEIGVDILNPIQLSAAQMDPKKLKAEFGRDITFWGGGCDTQRVLPYGTPQEVREEVKRRIGELAPGGGYVFNQIHNIQADVPPENIMAMYEAAAKYGAY
jgi:uroporphyrinogen decarboxylase